MFRGTPPKGAAGPVFPVRDAGNAARPAGTKAEDEGSKGGRCQRNDPLSFTFKTDKAVYPIYFLPPKTEVRSY